MLIGSLVFPSREDDIVNLLEFCAGGMILLIGSLAVPPREDNIVNLLGFCAGGNVVSWFECGNGGDVENLCG